MPASCNAGLGSLGGIPTARPLAPAAAPQIEYASQQSQWDNLVQLANTLVQQIQQLAPRWVARPAAAQTICRVPPGRALPASHPISWQLMPVKCNT